MGALRSCHREGFEHDGAERGTLGAQQVHPTIAYKAGHIALEILSYGHPRDVSCSTLWRTARALRARLTAAVIDMPMSDRLEAARRGWR